MGKTLPRMREWANLKGRQHLTDKGIAGRINLNAH
jgi:hypothetical protein